MRQLRLSGVCHCRTALALAIVLSSGLCFGEDLRAAKFEALGREFQKFVDAGTMPGDVILILQDGKPIYSATHGWADVEHKTPMQPDTLFRIASMTKPVTSLAIMMLAEQGKLAVTDPVSKYIPEYKEMRVLKSAGDAETIPAAREITISHLLTHTSGIAYGFTGPESYRNQIRESQIADGLSRSPLTVEENVKRIAALPLMHQPGERFTYGLNIDVLGRIIEVVSGKSLDEFFRMEIFEPLKMADTFFITPTDKQSRRVVLYTLAKDTPAARAADQLRTDLLQLSGEENGEPQRFFSGGGGLVSTAGDYARFLQMTLNGGELDGVRLLKPETVADMTSNHIGDLTLGVGDHGDKFGYGFGVWTPAGQKEGIPSVGSYSWSGAFGTYCWVDPQKKIVGVMMVQFQGPAPAPLRDILKKAVYEAIGP
jgi:CubicO group peptidase (beta-lactamase class C family)